MDTQNYSLHTHTVGFDGTNTVSEMVNRARELNLKTIGISNHFIVYENIKKAKMYGYAVQYGYADIYSSYFCEAREKFLPHYEEIARVQSENPDIKILRGMEVDFFDTPEWLEKFQEIIAELKPDYTIGSAHFIEHDGKLLNSHDWASADAEIKDILIAKYWENIAKAGVSGLFTWMAHLDLPKKVRMGLEPKWAEYEQRAVDAIAKSNTAIEINTGCYLPYCYEPYPSKRILKMVSKKKIPVLLSDDAHKASQLCRHFDEAQLLFQKFNLKKYQR